MKTRKPAPPSRRGFLARFAAVGTMLGGVVPELRASTLLETPVAPPQANPLPPAASALLYSAALTDAEVKMLLANAGPGASVMPPEHTYDIGGEGQAIALPVRSSNGNVIAYVLYGNSKSSNSIAQTTSSAIKILLKDNGTATIAINRAVYSTPPEADRNVEILYGSFFTEKYLDEKLGSDLPVQVFAQQANGGKVDARLKAIDACKKTHRACLRGLIQKGKMANGAIMVCTACSATAASALTCAAPCIMGLQWARSYYLGIEACERQFGICLEKARWL